MGGEDLPIIENKMLNEQLLFQMGRVIEPPDQISHGWIGLMWVFVVVH